MTPLSTEGRPDLHRVSTPVEVRLALELGEPPVFDGVCCVDCGKRFNTQSDHVEPHVANGPASTDNLKWRCWPCHQAKTERDRKAGKLTPRPPNEEGSLPDEVQGPPDDESGPPMTTSGPRPRQ